jgi:hypothetical protein
MSTQKPGMDEEEDNFVEHEDDEIEIIEDEENELHYSVEGLGQFHDIEGQKIFVKTDDCVNCIHDIQIALRKENTGESRRVDKYLGSWQVLQKCLVPLFLHYREDSKIWTGVLKLLVILTRPLSSASVDKRTHIKFLQDYKEALNTQDMFITLMSILVDAVSHNERTETQINEINTQIAQIDEKPIHVSMPTLEPEQQPVDAGETQQVMPDDPTLLQIRQEEEERRIRKERKKQKEHKKMEIRLLSEKSKSHEKNVELVLTLIRHILEIPDPKAGDPGYTTARETMQVQLIKHLSDEGVLEVLIMFAEQVDLPRFKHLNWLFFEVFYHICATIPPGEIANYDQLLKVDLTRLLDMEKKKMYAQVPQYTRHSRFATASVLKAVPPARGGSGIDLVGSVVNQKAAKTKYYRERKAPGYVGPDGQVIDPAGGPGAPANIFKDPAFIDIVLSDDPNASSLPSSILGKDYKEFFADIKSFIDQFISSVFTSLMQSVFVELQNEKNMHDYDMVRVLNMITWILDYEYKLIKKKTKKAAPVVLTDSIIQKVSWTIGVDALQLVSKQVKLHSKEAKTIKAGGANLVVALRALLEQIKIAKLLGPNTGDAFTIVDSFCYDEIPRVLTWTIRNYKPTAHRPEVLTFAIECVSELLRVIDAFAAAEKPSVEAKKKKRKPKITQQEAELQGIDFYDQGYSDSDVSIRSDDEEGNNGVDFLLDAKAGIMADLCHGESIGHLFFLLQNFKDNSIATNDAVCATILRIVREHESYAAYFFQLSYLVILFNIISDASLRAVEEERQKFDSVILIAKLIIRKFIKVARINKNVFVEILFPRTKAGRYGSLLTIESDLSSICNNYTDEEARLILERIHQGDSYEDLKAEKRERAFYNGAPWTEEEDQQLIGLWGHVNGMEGKSRRDKINTIIANTVPIREGMKKRRFKDVKRRLIQLGLLEQVDNEEDDDGWSEYSQDDDYQPRDTSSASSSSEEEEDKPANRMNFQEYVKRVNAVKVSDAMVSMIEKILQDNVPLTFQEKETLGHETLVKFLGA